MYNSKEKQNKQNKRKMNTQNVNVIVDEIDSGYSSSSSSVVVSKSSLNKYGNYTDIKEFASSVISDANEKKYEYKTFLFKESKNGLIFAPTQVGKTNATKDFMEVCMEHDIPIVVSCDNKTDQLEQFYSRIKIDFSNTNVILLKAGDNNFKKDLKDNLKITKKIIIFCLDNNSQISKVKEQLSTNITFENIQFDKFCIIHDEGDVITKDVNIENITEEQSESHKEWLSFVSYFKRLNVDLKRIFVTATPENVVYKYKIEHVFVLDVPNNYIGYDKINYCEIENINQIHDILFEEIARRHREREYGIILYCTDKKIANGQDPLFVNICSSIENCVVSTYNGTGITVRVMKQRHFELCLKEFIQKTNKDIKDKKNKVSFKKIDTRVYTIQNMAIRDFYQICKDSNNGIIVTIGMDLMSRGISFVSSEKVPDALAATTMIYKPGMTMHAVGMCQTIGRITGMARPDLQRRLYASHDVIENYKHYNMNQKQYLEEIIRNNGKPTNEVMEMIELNKRLSRPLDRPKLKLKPKYKSFSDSESDNESIVGEIDGVNLQKLSKWMNDDSLVGRMIRFLYDQNEEISTEQFKNGIEYNGTDEEFRSNIRGGHAVKSQYGKLWIQKNNMIKLNDKIRNHLNSLN